MFEATVGLSSGLSVVKICWALGDEQLGAEKAPIILSNDVLGDTELLAKAKEERAMASINLKTLMTVLKDRHGFVLGEKMIDAPESVLKEFSERWITEARQSGGISREMLNAALAGEGQPEVLDFAEEWKMLLLQLSEPECQIETDTWSFVLYVKKAERSFWMPYCSTAMSVCNRLIQHYNRD